MQKGGACKRRVESSSVIAEGSGAIIFGFCQLWRTTVEKISIVHGSKMIDKQHLHGD